MKFDKYERFGDYHWRLYAEKKDPYAFHADKVSEWIGPGKTLDVGAGDGLITSLISGAIGIDDNKTAIDLARRHGVDVRFVSVYSLGCPFFNYFDNVLMADVIEHLNSVEAALRRVKGVLKHNGNLFIVTPPALSSGKVFDPYHVKEYSPGELVSVVKKEGFELIGSIEIKNSWNRMYAKFKLT